MNRIYEFVRPAHWEERVLELLDLRRFHSENHLLISYLSADLVLQFAANITTPLECVTYNHSILRSILSKALLCA